MLEIFSFFAITLHHEMQIIEESNVF